MPDYIGVTLLVLAVFFLGYILGRGDNRKG